MLHEIFKEIGETPLQAINNFKDNHNKNPDNYKIKKISYAGRLDPMAKGLLIALTNELCFHQNDFHYLNKEYYFDVICGFSTDTLDILGILKNKSDTAIDLSEKSIKLLKESILEIKEQKYPNYSSVRVKGKPLWQWTKEGNLDLIDVPSKKVKIFAFDLIKVIEITEEELMKKILCQISFLKSSGFRKEEIITDYKNKLINPKKIYEILQFKTLVSSGVYIRGLTEHIGSFLGCETTAMNITRSKIEI